MIFWSLKSILLTCHEGVSLGFRVCGLILRCLQILHAGAPGQAAEQQDRRSSRKLAPVVLDTAQLRVNKRKNLVFYGELRA